MAPHSSILAWKIPWMEEPGRLQSMGSLRVGHNWATSLSLSLSCIGEGNGNPLQCSCLENPRDRGVWWAAVCGVAQSRTRLKWLSSSSNPTPFHPLCFRHDENKLNKELFLFCSIIGVIMKSRGKFILKFIRYWSGLILLHEYQNLSLG